jgi:hypothetical protein
MAAIFVISAIGVLLFHFYYLHSLLQDFAIYMNNVKSIERDVIKHVPIYDDFADRAKEDLLRKFLQADHLKAAENYGLKPVDNENELKDKVKSGELVSIDTSGNSLHYFYGVGKENRYLIPEAARGLQIITERFQKNMNKGATVPPVKIAISSAIRTSLYQRNLMKKNLNAVHASTHSYGTSFDIFFDEYFVVIPDIKGSNATFLSMSDTLHTRLGFLLGASLRRQFKSILMETLLQLQEEGYIYAILEKHQRCYHVTVLKISPEKI